MMNRREFTLGAGALCALPWVTPAARAAVEVGDNGLHVQSWFIESFLDLKEDVATAASEGRHLAVVFEQRGCPYCKEMHAVNLQDDRIVSYVRENFDILQLDLWGSRGVTDFDGEEMEERALARRWQINFTPTIIFFPNDPAAVDGKIGRNAEIARMPGYFKPFHFLSMFEFVREGLYRDQSFQRYLQNKFEKLRAEGKDPDVW